MLALLMGLALAGAERPNILVVLADDLGFADLGCYGGEIATPHLDRLAAGGVRFRQFYNCTRCCPSRACLLTGLHPHQAGVGNMTGDQGLPGYRGFPQPHATTIAEVLRGAGYAASMVGKWHLSANKRSPTPVERGFDEFFGMIGGFNSCFREDPFYTRLPAGRGQRSYPKDGFYSTDAFADYALDFLADARKSKRPFFQYLAFNAPHFPLHAKPEDIKKYENTYSVGWDALRERRLAKQIELGLLPKGTPLAPRSPWTTRKDFLRSGDNPAWRDLPAARQADLARRMAVYAAMVDRLDQAVGRIVADLRQHGELDNTLILFLSDNGACAEWDPFGFDGSSGPNNVLHEGAALAAMGGPDTYHSYGSGWANAGCTPFRQYKHYCHEGGIRTPLIAHWPNGIAARGEFRDQVGHLVDLMATCVDLAGAEYPKTRAGVAVPPMEGTSLRPAFANQPLPRDFLAWEHDGRRALRQGDWKLVAKEGAAWELYDLAADPIELRDRAAAEPQRVAALSALWDAWATRCHVFPKPAPTAGKGKKKAG